MIWGFFPCPYFSIKCQTFQVQQVQLSAVSGSHIDLHRKGYICRNIIMTRAMFGFQISYNFIYFILGNKFQFKRKCNIFKQISVNSFIAIRGYFGGELLSNWWKILIETIRYFNLIFSFTTVNQEKRRKILFIWAFVYNFIDLWPCFTGVIWKFFELLKIIRFFSGIYIFCNIFL